ncbi:MAG TPA: GDP-mannose 4,6-dehydratase [Kiritimatiellia bacterium]|nr:GDP-mannose 4,6-dehydratase [Kiritimatiellia bacterium]
MNVFITGGAGFIGCNLARHHLQRGDQVVVFDNLSRQGTPSNLRWLQGDIGGSLTCIHGDIRDDAALLEALPSDADRVYHLAGQVAVTTSVIRPREDFEINALGTFNVLEATRAKAPGAVVIYSSTNKVYGEMAESEMVLKNNRYAYRRLPRGIPEEQPLDFHSPYGCSKGAGDQYVRDYARIYGLNTVVMRQSCIYGLRQFGVEDQGWIAHFCIAAVFGRNIHIYGDGKQVRDVLWVEDLIEAYEAAASRIDVARGEVFNIGGGPENTLSVWTEFQPHLERLAGRRIDCAFGPWRPGDQRIYCSDISKAERLLSWRPRTRFAEGIDKLYGWIAQNPHLFA